MRCPATHSPSAPAATSIGVTGIGRRRRTSPVSASISVTLPSREIATQTASPWAAMLTAPRPISGCVPWRSHAGRVDAREPLARRADHPDVAAQRRRCRAAGSRSPRASRRPAAREARRRAALRRGGGRGAIGFAAAVAPGREDRRRRRRERQREQRARDHGALPATRRRRRGGPRASASRRAARAASAPRRAPRRRSQPSAPARPRRPRQPRVPRGRGRPPTAGGRRAPWPSRAARPGRALREGPARSADGSGGGSERWAQSLASSLSRSNGTAPVSMKCSTPPSA